MLTFLVYNSILLLSAVFSYTAEHSKTKISRIISRIVLFNIFFIPAAIRYGIGTDFFTYQDIFYSQDDNIEPVYLLINKLVYALNIDVQWVFIITAIITYIPLCFLLKRKNFFIIIVMYVLIYYLSTYNTVRQAMAISFIICGVSQLIYGYKWKYLFFIVIASLCHLSSIIAIPFAFIYKIKINNTVLISAIILLFAFSKMNIIEILANSNLFTGSRYGYYLATDFIEEANMGSGLGFLSKIIIPLLLIILKFKFKSSDTEYSVIYYFSIAYILLYILGIQIFIFTRVAAVYIFAPIFATTLLLKLFSSNNRMWIFSIIFLMYWLVFQKTIIDGSILNSGGLGINPYTTIFDTLK